MNNNVKILLCAYACEPNKGSEPGVGWETSVHLSKSIPDINFLVITRKNNKESINQEKYPANLQFLFYDLPKGFIVIKKTIPFIRSYYYLWMIGATIKLWKRRKEFQIIHHITFVNDWFPSIFIMLKNNRNKFVWGPIGSNERVPSKFIFKSKHKTIEFFKSIILVILRRVDVFFWICKAKDDIIIGTSPFVEKNLKLNNNNKKKFISIPGIGIREESISSDINIDKIKKKTFTIISVGQLIYIKNFRLSIKAFHLFLESIPVNMRHLVKLQIIGRGSQKQELLNYIRQLNLEKNVDFLGYIDQIKLMDYYDKADAFLYPTLENAGFVILEAMSKGLPVIALKHGGPGQFVKKNTEQQLVDVNLPIEIIEKKIATLLLNIFEDKDLRMEIGNLNKKTLREEFTWNKKAEKFKTIYQNLLIKLHPNAD